MHTYAYEEATSSSIRVSGHRTTAASYLGTGVEVRPNRALQRRTALTLTAFAGFVAVTLLLTGTMAAVVTTCRGFSLATALISGVGVPFAAAVVEACAGISV